MAKKNKISHFWKNYNSTLKGSSFDTKRIETKHGASKRGYQHKSRSK